MIKLFLLIFSSIIVFNRANCQTIIEIEVDSQQRVSKVDVRGIPTDTIWRKFYVDTAWEKFIIKDLSTSKLILEGAKKGKYVVSMRFIVTKDGSISDVQCDKDPGYGICEASIIAVNRSSKSVSGPVSPIRSSYIKNVNKK